MPKVMVNGVRIEHELSGTGAHTVVITPGGRFSMDTPGIRELAQRLVEASARRGVLWLDLADPVPDQMPSDLEALAIPVLILPSSASDPSHPRATSEAVHALIPGARIAEPPWGEREFLGKSS